MSEGINIHEAGFVAHEAPSTGRPIETVVRLTLGALRHWARPYLFRLADAVFWFLAAQAASHLWLGADLGETSRVQVAIGYLLPFSAFFLFPMAGCYRSWRTLDLFAMLRPVLFATFWVGLAALAFAFIVHEAAGVSRGWFLFTLLFAFASSSSLRIAALSAQHWVRRNGFDLRNIMVFSNGGSISKMLELVEANPGYGYRVAGVMGGLSAAGSHADTSDTVRDFITSKQIDEVWIASHPDSAEEMLPLLKQLRQTAVPVRWLPDISWLSILGCREENLMGVPSLLLNATAIDSSAGRVAKAIFDRVFALLVLLCLSPLMLLIALLVRLGSPGPVLFGQLRQGLSGKPFRCLKFRTMVMHAESGTVTQATANDSRITPFGRFLRRTSLDELPQFINVLLGHMSVVGPRPHAVQHNEFYRSQIDRYMQRHRAKPGITGWAQVNGHRGETDTLDKMARRVEHDIYYMNNWSFWLDMKIIVWTALKGWTGRNAY